MNLAVLLSPAAGVSPLLEVGREDPYVEIEQRDPWQKRMYVGSRNVISNRVKVYQTI
jgi:hypothetical protein